MARRVEQYVPVIKQARGYYSNYPISTAVRDIGGLVYNVKAYGALGDGVTDDTTAIQTALNAANPGGKVVMPQGTYRTSLPLLIPPYVTLEGVRGNTITQTNHGTVIKPLSSWGAGNFGAAPAVLLICDATTGGYSITSNEQAVGNLYIDQSSMVKGSNWADGIELYGSVVGCYIYNVQVNNCTSTAFHCVNNASGMPGTIRVEHVLTQGSYYSGFGLVANDTTFIDCVSLGDGQNGFSGWTISSGGNNRWIGCRAEWASTDGFNITDSTTFNLAQTMNFVGCSTDRNSHNGFNITGSAKTAINISGCYVHRDGRNGGSGGGGYAAFAINGYSGMVNITGCSTAPGVDDNGSGPDTPQYAIATSGTNGMIVVDGTVLHAFSSTINDAGTDTVFYVSPSCLLATGADSNPTFAGLNPTRISNGTTLGSHLYSGSGAPNISASVAGDFYLRTDTPSTANQRLYVATAANTWTGIV